MRIRFNLKVLLIVLGVIVILVGSGVHNEELIGTGSRWRCWQFSSASDNPLVLTCEP